MAINGRVLRGWIAVILTVGATLGPLVLSNLYPESDLLRWMRNLVLLVVMPLAVLFAKKWPRKSEQRYKWKLRV